MPELKFPNFDLPEDLEKAAGALNEAVKDAAYAAVGFGVLGIQRAQVHRNELTKQLGEHLAGLAKAADDALAPMRHEIDGRLDEIEGRLPPAAGSVFHSLRESAGAGERIVRSAVGLRDHPQEPGSRSPGSGD